MEVPLFISTEDLQTLISCNLVQIVDSGFNHKESFVAGHIPTAKYFNVAHIKNKSSPLTQEVPTSEEFREYMIESQIRSMFPTVVYDQNGFNLSGRAWYLLTHFGVRYVRILDGGLPKWRSEGRQIESGEQSISHLKVDISEYKFSEGLNNRLSFEQVLQLTNQIESQEIDAKIWDPRPLEAYNEGAVDTAVNLPIGQLFNENKTVKSKEEVREIIRSRIGDRKIVTSCLRGNNACLAYLLLAYIEHQDRWAYTGSFEEWKMRKN
jgi:thiosulfate/3-mercaptopyruvate sulfurtransferase